MTISDNLDLSSLKDGHVIVDAGDLARDIAHTAISAQKTVARFWHLLAAIDQAPFTFDTDPLATYVRWNKTWEGVICTPFVDDLGNEKWKLEGRTA